MQSGGDDQVQTGPQTAAEYVEKVHADGTVDLVDIKALGGDVEQMPAGYFYSAEFLGTLLATCLGSLIAFAGWTMPANTLSIINSEIGPSSDISWAAASYTVGQSIGFLLFGRLSDIFGRRWIVILNTVIGLVGCILGGRAQNVEMLIVAMILNGLASAGQFSFGITLGELVSNTHRGPVLTGCFISSMPFSVFGPVIARRLIQNTEQGWRWCFYIGAILSGITTLLYFFFYHPPTYTQLHVQGKTKWQQVKELDYVGMFLFVAGSVLFLVGISWGGTTRPWTDAGVLSSIIIGGVTLVALGFYEQYVVNTAAFMPPRLFKNIPFLAITLIAWIGAMIYFSMSVLLPRLLGGVYQANDMAIGWQSLILGGGTLLGQTIAGFTISYVPHVKLQTILAAISGCAFFGALASLSASKNAELLILGLLGATSIGFIDNIAFPGVTLVIEAQDIGLATGVMGSIRAMGGAVAQVLYVAILDEKLRAYIPSYVAPVAREAGLAESSIPTLLNIAETTGHASAFASSSVVPGMTKSIVHAVTPAVVRAYVDAFRTVFFATIPFGVVLVVSAAYVPDMEGYLGNDVAKRLQRARRRMRRGSRGGGDAGKEMGVAGTLFEVEGSVPAPAPVDGGCNGDRRSSSTEVVEVEVSMP